MMGNNGSTVSPRIPFVGLRVPTYVVVVVFGVLGFVFPMAFGLAIGIPDCHAHDECSYLVAADTYSHFRVTNPTPKSFESFETPHILVEPSYISKYPPGQGIILAAGKLIFGDFIFGVWLSCGLLAAALYWMLSVWTRQNWAMAGTLLMIGLIGTNSYWAQSYWGGMVAATGGALFLGGYRRLFRNLSVGSTLWMVLGGIVLVNSRPFEGTASMVLPLSILLVWLVRSARDTIATKLSTVVVPGVILTCIGLSMMGYQYYRVTGSIFTLPYTVHQAQYYPTPLFVFQSPNPEANRGNARLREVYESYTSPTVLEDMKIPGAPYSIALSPVYGFAYLCVALGFFLFSPLLAVLVYVTIPISARRNRWNLLIVASILTTFAIVSLGVWWDQYHYSAALTASFFLLAVEGLRYFYVRIKRAGQVRAGTSLIAGLIAAAVVYQHFYAADYVRIRANLSKAHPAVLESLRSGTPVDFEVPRRATFFKADVDRMVETLPDRYLAIVSYDREYSYHDEIVYNKSDIEQAKMVWAHDLGEEKNRRLIADYGGRKIILIHLAGSRIQIVPLAEGQIPTWIAGTGN